MVETLRSYSNPFKLHRGVPVHYVDTFRDITKDIISGIDLFKWIRQRKFVQCFYSLLLIQGAQTGDVHNFKSTCLASYNLPPDIFVEKLNHLFHPIHFKSNQLMKYLYKL